MIKGTALERTKRAGLLRNAMSILMEDGNEEALAEIRRIAREDADEKVRHLAMEMLNR
jgi:epoxyqueuosine reductase QueG